MAFEKVRRQDSFGGRHQPGELARRTNRLTAHFDDFCLFQTTLTAHSPCIRTDQTIGAACDLPIKELAYPYWHKTLVGEVDWGLPGERDVDCGQISPSSLARTTAWVRSSTKSFLNREEM